MRDTTNFTSITHARRRRIWLATLLGAVIGLVLGALFAAQLVSAASISWERALRITFVQWVMPFVVFLCGWILVRFLPFERGRLRWRLPLHICVALLLATAAALFEQYVIRPGMLGPGMKGGLPPRSLFLENEDGRERFAGTRPPPPGFDENQPQPPAAPPRDFAPGGPGAGGRFMHGPPSRPFFFALIASPRWQLNVVMYVLGAVLMQMWLFYYRMQERERRAAELAASLSAAKLDALRLQLQPHFLFNSLNAIATLVHRSPQAAEDMIINLSALLRESLDTATQEHPLRRELHILDHYLNMEQERFGARLRITQNIAPGALDAPVPSLFLQPLVENAVRHGIEPRTEPGEIAITARRDGDRLLITIRNDGLPAARENKNDTPPRANGRGIGLSNTAARIRETYGDNARFSFTRTPDGGALVEIELPVKTASAHS